MSKRIYSLLYIIDLVWSYAYDNFILYFVYCKNYLAMNLKCRFKYFTTIWPGKAECLAYWHWRHYRPQKAAWTCSWCENPSFSLSTIFQSKSALIRKTNYDKVHIWLSVLSVSNDEGLLFIKKNYKISMHL